MSKTIEPCELAYNDLLEIEDTCIKIAVDGSPTIRLLAHIKYLEQEHDKLQEEYEENIESSIEPEEIIKAIEPLIKEHFYGVVYSEKESRDNWEAVKAISDTE